MNDIMVFDDRPLLSTLILAGHHQKGMSGRLSKVATPVTLPVRDHITKNLVLSRSLQGWMARASEFGGLQKVRGEMRANMWCRSIMFHQILEELLKMYSKLK